MKCPICSDIDLIMTERQGVEIDYCPKCRGVWLDRGELDKIIERAGGTASTAQQNQSVQPSYPYPPEHHSHQNGHHGYHRKKSWLGELFD